MTDLHFRNKLNNWKVTSKNLLLWLSDSPYFLQHFNNSYFILLTKLDLIHELFLNAIFICASLFLSILSIFLFCLMIDKKTAVFWEQPHVITRGNMMSCTFSLHGVSNQSGSTFWMSHGQTPYFLCFFVPLIYANGPHAVK